MARYDRVVPPGGKGKITLVINTTRLRGSFKKKDMVWSNDPARRGIALYLKGTVRPHIDMKPGGYLSLNGHKNRVPKERLEIINNHESPLKILGVENKLPNHIKWSIKEVKPGFVYRLEVEDISNKAGIYSGRLNIRTNNPLKPRLVVIINGQIKH